MARDRVLITGFGPFPGVPENPSAWLAEALAERARHLPCELKTQVLPTEWEAVAALTPALYEAVGPRVMIHFGVSQRARGFRIERSAHNVALPRADARGALPASPVIRIDGAHRLDAALPARSLAAQLRARGLFAVSSRSAGRYLCNFLYYRSLDWAGRQESACLALFVHVPPGPSQGGPFTEDEMLKAAEEILSFTLAAASNTAECVLAARPTGAALPGGEMMLSAKDS